MALRFSWLRIILATLVLPAVSVRATAQQPLQSVHGTVRDSAGAPIGGAEIVLGQRRTETNGQGLFRIDSLRPGQYPIAVRLVGYAAVRSHIVVVATEPTEVSYILLPAPFLLPTVVVEAQRTGIRGSVGDTGYRAAVGARVQVIGFQGGEVQTDSMGRFAFPDADRGAYMVRVTFRGFTERRIMVELKRGEGRELAVMLTPTSRSGASVEEGTVRDLGLRLSMGLSRERMSGQNLAVHGSGGLCDVPEIRSKVGRQTTLILNGTTIIPEFDLPALCSWRADEVELVEFGADVCKEATQTIRSLLEGPLRMWCSGRTRNVTRSLRGGGQRVGTQQAGTSYVVIWEKR